MFLWFLHALCTTCRVIAHSPQGDDWCPLLLTGVNEEAELYRDADLIYKARSAPTSPHTCKPFMHGPHYGVNRTVKRFGTNVPLY